MFLDATPCQTSKLMYIEIRIHRLLLNDLYMTFQSLTSMPRVLVSLLPARPIWKTHEPSVIRLISEKLATN